MRYDPVKRQLSAPGWVEGDFHAVLKLRDDEFTIDAERIEFDQAEGSIDILPEEGKLVRIGRTDRVITAGKVHIDTNTSLFTGEGGVSASFMGHDVTSSRLETDVAESHARFIGEVRVHFQLSPSDTGELRTRTGIMGSFNPEFEFIDIVAEEIDIDFSRQSGAFSIESDLEIISNDVILNAGGLKGDYLTQNFVLGGGVRITADGNKLTCENASIDMEKNESDFSGGVEVRDESGDIVLNCRRVVVGLDERENAWFRSEEGELKFRLNR